MTDLEKLERAMELFAECSDGSLAAAFIDAVAYVHCGFFDEYLEAMHWGMYGIWPDEIDEEDVEYAANVKVSERLAAVGREIRSAAELKIAV